MPSGIPTPAGAPAGAADGALSCDLPDFTASTSDFTTRPCGPVPEMAPMSMLASLARRFASGEEKTRAEPLALVALPWLLATAAMATSFVLGGRAAVPVVTGAGAAAGAAGCGASAALGAGAGATAGAFTSAALSPSVRSTAITALTFTLSVPSGTTILPILPSSTASTSMVALSVSISAITSPEETLSPSLTCHLASLPSSIVGESAGMVMLMLI